jgi:spore maturation protein A
MLGLGWAATPAGLEAIKALAGEEETEKVTGSERVATDAMCDFLILNISSLQLIPVSIIAYRSQYGSVNPSEIVGPAMLATSVSTLAAVVFIKIRQAVGRNL